MKLIATLFFVMISASVCFADDQVLDEVLKNVVVGERVDYDKLSSAYAEKLITWLASASKVDAMALGDKDRLAYFINVYNATMLKAVIDHDIKTFKPNDADFKVFKDPLVKLKTGVVSLDELENKIIRPTFNDPRVHAALVCGAVSCPPLLNHAYSGNSLDQQLDDNVSRWLSDPARNQVDDAGRVLKLSSIFDWFAADFGGKKNVSRWVSERVSRDVSGYRVEFNAYDWSLNKLAK